MSQHLLTQSPAPITAECFREAVGHDPEQDDLDRCNCAQAGEVMHTMCGWDIRRGMPNFIPGAPTEYQRGERVEWSNGGWGVLEARSQDEDTGTPEFCMDHDDGRPARLWVIRFDNGTVGKRCCEREIKQRAEFQQRTVRIRLPHDFTCQQVANNAVPEFPKDGCECLRCQTTRINNPLMIVNPDGTLEPTARLSNDQITWFNNIVKMLPEKDREIAELKAENAHSRAECARLADGPPTQHPPEYVAGILMSREGRTDLYAHARLTEVIRCARLDGRKQARDELAAKDARIAELDTELALLRRAAFGDPAAKPPSPPTPNPNAPAYIPPALDTAKPKPNPFRDFPTDPRRMGP